MATIKPFDKFDAETQAKGLRAAMKGLGTDEDAIIKTLTHCDLKQRLLIANKYKTLFGRDLVSDFKSELSGKFEDTVVALMTPLNLLYARELRKAMKGLGTDEGALIEILCTKPNSEIRAIKEEYKKEFKHDLEKDIQSDTSGHFKRLLVSLSNAHREETRAVDAAMATQDAKDIYTAGEGKFGTDETTFSRILCSRSFPQLRATFEKYQQLVGNDIEKAIKNETSGSLRDGYLAIVKTIRDPIEYFAERLYKSMKGLGTDDQTLIRIIVTRCELDLKHIADAFHRMYGKYLTDFIKGDTSGDYKKLLLAIC